MGISRGEMLLDKVTLIAGMNGNGKSSIAQALGSALKSAALPDGVKKVDSKFMVHDGATDSMVSLYGENFEIRLALPKGDVTSTGIPLRSSEIGVGTVRLTDMDEKTKAATILKYLKTLPSIEDLGFALEQKGLAQYREALWKEIETKGWDLTLKAIQEKGTKAKGGWEASTGENYGSAKAVDWKPEVLKTCGVDWMATDWEPLRADAQKKYESVIATNAISEEQKASLQAVVDTQDKVIAALDLAERNEREIKGALDEHQRIQRPVVPQIDSCPHCSKGLVIRNGKIEKSSVDKVDTAEIISKQNSYDNILKELTEKADLLIAAANFQRSKMQNVSDALEKLGSATPSKAETPEKEKWKTELDEINAIITAKAAYEQASKYAKTIAETALLIEMMSPTGLRQQKLAGALDATNGQLDNLCESAGWKAVRIEPDLSVTYGGRAYRFISQSEKYRVDATLQIMFGTIDQSAMMIFDEADVLDQSGRNGLFNLLSSHEIPALVCMTMNDRSKVPNLEQAGMGQSYWVEAGIIQKV